MCGGIIANSMIIYQFVSFFFFSIVLCYEEEIGSSRKNTSEMTDCAEERRDIDV